MVTGESVAAAEVRRLLRERGVRDASTRGCQPVVADVTPRGASLQVTLTDADGRHDVRHVTDAGTAAAVIESWARSDLEAELLRPRAAPPPTPVVAPAATASVSEHPAPAVALGLMALGAYASDGSVWLDTALAGCRELGPLCVGGLARASFDTIAAGESEQLGTNRVAVELLAIAEVPVDLGRFTLRPGIGVGGGWMRSVEDEEEDPDDSEVVDRAVLRFDAHLRATVLRVGELTIEAGVFADVAPLAHTSRFVVDDGEDELAGEPRWSLRAGLGVGYIVR